MSVNLDYGQLVTTLQKLVRSDSCLFALHALSIDHILLSPLQPPLTKCLVVVRTRQQTSLKESVNDITAPSLDNVCRFHRKGQISGFKRLARNMSVRTNVQTRVFQRCARVCFVSSRLLRKQRSTQASFNIQTCFFVELVLRFYSQ